MKKEKLKVIYKPAGKAQEYAESFPGAQDGYALNIYKGCAHRCAYCYVPEIMPWRTMPAPKESFHKEVEQRKDMLIKLEKDCAQLRDSEIPLHLCFTCDPYPEGENRHTRDVLLVLQYYGLKNIQILTKAGTRALVDMDIMQECNWAFGSTVVFCEDDWSFNSQAHGLEQMGFEPEAPGYEDRAQAIETAHDNGVYTWVSIEPVIDPAQALSIIDRLRPHVDFWKIGKLNHGSQISPELGEIEASVDWTKFLKDVRSMFSDPSEYLIKKSLLKFESRKENKT